MSRDKDIFDKGVPWLAIVIAVFVSILGITWIAEGNDFFMYKVFAPRREEVRREVFVQSQAYNESMAQDLARAQREYVTADKPEQKQAIASLIVQQYAGYDDTKLSPDLRNFLNQIRQSQGIK